MGSRRVKKKLTGILIMMILSLTLSACGKDYIPEMTDEELADVEEYAVKLLLKYNSGYNGHYLSEEEAELKNNEIMEEARLQAEVKAKKEAAASANAVSSNESDSDKPSEDEKQEPVYTDISEFLAMPEIDIDYASYEICDSYPNTTESNDFQGVVYPSTGNKLLILHFNVTNNSGEDYFVDIPGTGLKSAVKINGVKTKVPLTTMLLDDLYNCRMTLTAGQSIEQVLVVEISSSDAEDITSLDITFKYAGQKMDMSIL